jgi:hypothetical protein
LFSKRLAFTGGALTKSRVTRQFHGSAFPTQYSSAWRWSLDSQSLDIRLKQADVPRRHFFDGFDDIAGFTPPLSAGPLSIGWMT